MLDAMIKDKFNTYNENDINDTVSIMALIDHRYNFNDTVEQYNTRLRESVANNFYKGFLNDAKKELFRNWEDQLNNLPLDASREDIFKVAPEKALHIVGF